MLTSGGGDFFEKESRASAFCIFCRLGRKEGI